MKGQWQKQMSNFSYDEAKSAARAVQAMPTGRKFIQWIIENICMYNESVYDYDNSKMVENAVRHDVAQEILNLIKPEGEV